MRWCQLAVAGLLTSFALFCVYESYLYAKDAKREIGITVFVYMILMLHGYFAGTFSEWIK